MKTSKYSESQITQILKQAAGGVPVPELCRAHGMSSATFYKWRSKYAGMDASMISRLKTLEAENLRLKKLYAEAQLHADTQGLLGKKVVASSRKEMAHQLHQTHGIIGRN